MSSGFQYPAFISYRNGVRKDAQGNDITFGSKQMDTYDEFAKQLCNQLHSELKSLITANRLPCRPFLDQEHGGEPHTLEPFFAQKICRSVCMIVIYTESYFDTANTFCAREFMTMQKIQEHRNSVLGYTGTLKQVYTINRSKNSIPKIFGKEFYVNLATKNFRKNDYWCNEDNDDLNKMIENIINFIWRTLFLGVYKGGTNPKLFSICSDFDLVPNDAEVKKFIKKHTAKRAVQFP